MSLPAAPCTPFTFTQPPQLNKSTNQQINKSTNQQINKSTIHTATHESFPTKRLLFVLSGNLSTTPRAIKSIRLSIRNNQVDVLKVNRHPKWNALDIDLEQELQIQPVTVSLAKKPFFPWLKSTMLFQISKVFAGVFKHSLGIQAFATQKVFIQIAQRLKKVQPAYDLIIGHGSGTIYPVYAYAQRHNIPFSLDIEDYYPGETKNPAQQKRTEFLLKKIIPEADSITYASPLIGKHILKLLDTPPKKHFLINNSFPSSEFLPPSTFHLPPSTPLRLIWFSQNIAPNRGLEQIITAMKVINKANEKIKRCQPELDSGSSSAVDLAKAGPTTTLTLIGNLYPSFATDWINPNAYFITIHPPMPQSDLHRKLGEYDIGLAIEPGKDLNNDIALSNKIFAYAQSGLFILATDTQAQRLFMEEHPWSGVVCSQEAGAIKQTLQNLLSRKEEIRQAAVERYEKAKALGWENEEGKLLEVFRVG